MNEAMLNEDAGLEADRQRASFDVIDRQLAFTPLQILEPSLRFPRAKPRSDADIP